MHIWHTRQSKEWKINRDPNYGVFMIEEDFSIWFFFFLEAVLLQCKRSHFEARYFLWRIIILDMEQFTTLFLVSSLWVCVRWRLAKCNGTQIMSCTNSRSYLLHAQHEELTKLFWDNEEYKTSKSSHSSCNLSKKSI